MGMYPNLNVHSYYSFLSSSLSIDDIINFSLENQLDYACLVDENVMYGSLEFYKSCKKHNLKPILGLSINYEESNLVLIAKNNLGYKDLLKISSLVMTNKSFKLLGYLSDNLFVIRMSGNFIYPNKNNFYINGTDDENAIACHEARFYESTDFNSYQLIKAIKNETKLDASFIHETNEMLCLWNDEQMKHHYSKIALDNLVKVVNSIDLELDSDTSKNILEFPTPNKIPSKDYLNQLVKQNLDIYINKHPSLDKQKYLNRLEYELDVINAKGFNDYFLIVQDFINWAKQKKIIVGPGRGSAAGSLVSFLLNITEIDPIEYNLLFERFLNKDRMSMPDIDTDIMDSRRDEVIDYLFNKYGTNHVAHIITFSKMKAKTAIRDTARVLGTNLAIVDKICKNISLIYEDNLEEAINHSKILLEEVNQNPELFMLASKLIGLPRQFGTHAAGIVLSNTKLTDVLPIQNGLNNRSMCQYSMEYLEDLGLIKMDLLGLRNLTILDNILKLIKYTKNIDINLQEIDTHDKATFELLSRGETNGIFQLESEGMRKILKRMNVSSIEDISLVSAMYRPGAMQNINLYLERRKNNTQPQYLNKEIEQVLAPTYGVIIYQEQIIQLVQIIAKFDGAKSDTFRRAISKKKEDVILSMRKEFVDAAISNHYSEKDALEIFNYMEQFASYGFNHSHSLAYSYISYWLAYLKTHYPLQTISVLMSFGDASKEKIISYIKESKVLGIKIVGPNINESTMSFVILNKSIIFSLTSIAGLGRETAKKIIQIRDQQPNKKFTDAIKAIAILANNGVSTKILESLIKVGAFDELYDRRQFLLGNLSKITNEKLNLIDKDGNFIFDLNLDENIVENHDEYYLDEQKLLGVSFVKNRQQELFNKYENAYQLINFDDVKTTTNKFKSLVELVSCFKTQTSTNKPMLRWTIIQNNKKYYLYSFSNLEELENEAKNIKYLLGEFKPYRDTFTLTGILKGEN